MKVPKRIENIIINALQGGVVPRTGLGYIAVGREKEISALLKDLEIIEMGGSTFRFVTGNYGSGKTFLLQTIKEHAVAKGFVVADADLSPERALIGTSANKKGLATYRELMSNISIKTSPTGGGLEKILDLWMSSMWVEIAQRASSDGINGTDLVKKVSDQIYSTIFSMNEMTSGFDFANILGIYWKAKQSGDIELKNKALRWLRGDYRTKREARNDLGINNIINDEDWFNYIKLFSKFFSKIGYKGFIIMIDEMINIYKAAQTRTRQNNYERMLNMYNDALQGKAEYLGIIMAGTPKSVEDKERGVFSYEALKSRLYSGKYQDINAENLMTPIIRIQPLSKSELIVLLEKISLIHADLYNYIKTIDEKELIEFIDHIYNDPDQYYVTPRSIIRDFINVLNILYQNPGISLENVINSYNYSTDKEIEPQETEE